MLILIAVISLIAIIVGILIYIKGHYNYEEAGRIIAVVGVIVLAIALLSMIGAGHQLATAHTIDKKIALYEQ